MVGARDTPAYAAANRDLWTRANREYGDDHADRAWAAEDITWGVFNVPEQQLGVLGDVAGLDVVELGCGTAYFSAWLARRGVRPTGVDVTPAQLATARRCQERSGIVFPLIEADAGEVPLPSGSFDLPCRSAVPACGATRPAGFPRLPGCCGQEGGRCSTPLASWPPCAVRNRPGLPAGNCCAHSGRYAGW
jgi:SAM-dependent methyltransferase